MKAGEQINPHLGGDFEDFLKEEGIYSEVTARAVKKVIAAQLKESMEQQDIKKTSLAAAMHTSRSSLDRLLNENDTSLTLTTLTGAASALGLRVNISFEPEKKLPAA